jgi:hypothetical protein
MWGQPPSAVRRAKPGCRTLAKYPSIPNPVILSKVAARKVHGNAVEGSLRFMALVPTIRGIRKAPE